MMDTFLDDNFFNLMFHLDNYVICIIELIIKYT